MRVGATATGSDPVWHVVAQDDSATLCGQPLGADDAAETDRHCVSCMAAFQDRMRNVTDA
ncbi:hypothetical protein [Streptomyces sp. NPDC047886]